MNINPYPVGLKPKSIWERIMKEEELKKGLDEVYAVGFKNGQIEMRNKILTKRQLFVINILNHICFSINFMEQKNII